MSLLSVGVHSRSASASLALVVHSRHGPSAWCRGPRSRLGRAAARPVDLARKKISDEQFELSLGEKPELHVLALALDLRLAHAGVHANMRPRASALLALARALLCLWLGCFSSLCILSAAASAAAAALLLGALDARPPRLPARRLAGHAGPRRAMHWHSGRRGRASS